MLQRLSLLLALTLLAGLLGCTYAGEDEREAAGPTATASTTNVEDLPDVGQDATDNTMALRFAWLDSEGDLILLDPETHETRSVDLPEVSTSLSAISWTGSGSVLAYITRQGQVVRKDLVTGEQADVGSGDMYMGTMFAISPDGRRVATVHMEELVVWEYGRKSTVKGPRNCTTPAWSHDSRLIAVGAMGPDESIDGGLWTANNWERAELLVQPNENGWGATQDIKWSPDGRWLAWARGAGDGWTGDIARSDGSDVWRDRVGDGPLQWFPDSSALLTRIHIEAAAFTTGIYRVKDHSLTQIGPDSWDSMAALSPDGALILAWGGDGTVLVVEAATGEETQWPEVTRVLHAAWAPDGRLGALIDDDGSIGAWIGKPDGTGEIVTAATTEAPEVARWITLPRHAAVLAD